MDQITTIKPMAQAEIAEAIRNATNEVFSTMLALDLVAQPIEIGDSAARSRAGVIALLGFAGDWVGSGILYCEARFGCILASRLLMAEYTSVDEDVLDAIAEVANMIIGNVKTVLEQNLGTLGLSTPTVIYGRNFEARTVGTREWVTVPFAAGDDIMGVQISIAPNPRKGRPANAKTTMAGTACPYCGGYER